MAHTADLLREVRTAGASEEVMKALRGIPAEQYGNREDVARSVRTDPDSDIPHSAAQRAEQACLGAIPDSPNTCGTRQSPRWRRNSTADDSRCPQGDYRIEEEIAMVRKKTEGDEDQRRAAAHEARRAGRTSSEEHATTGASKQRMHVPHSGSRSHEEKLAHVHEGKQGSRPRRDAEREAQARAAAEQPPERAFAGRGHPQYTEEHEQVFRALADAQRSHGGEAVHLQEIARSTRLPLEQTRTLMHDLTAVHGLVTELQGSDTPDMGPRYETKPGG